MRSILARMLAGLAFLVTVQLVLPAERAVAQEPSIDFQTFHEQLEPHGRWLQHATHGYVWSPDVDRDWRPYTRGQWVFTEEHGWYWESAEPFGWATFHYGRWFLDERDGWLWVPGTDWAPAWVAWRHSDEQVGWAPLPPEAEWRGDSLSFSESYYEAPRYSAAWCFVPIGLLTANRVYRHVAPPHRNIAFVRQTRWVPSHRTVDRRIFLAGFDRSRYERLTRRPLRPVSIVPSDRPGPGRSFLGNRGGTVQVYRPQIRGTQAQVPPPRIQESGERRRGNWQGEPGRGERGPGSGAGPGAPRPGVTPLPGVAPPRTPPPIQANQPPRREWPPEGQPVRPPRQGGGGLQQPVPPQPQQPIQPRRFPNEGQPLKPQPSIQLPPGAAVPPIPPRTGLPPPQPPPKAGGQPPPPQQPPPPKAGGQPQPKEGEGRGQRRRQDDKDGAPQR